MFRKFIALACLALVCGGAQAQTLPDPAQPEAAMDFFLGTWRTVGGIPQDDGSYTRSSGVLVAERAFRGGSTPSIMLRNMSIRAVDTDAEDNPFDIPYFEDISIYAFHRESGTWRGISHNTLGNRKWRDITVSDGQISFTQTGELFQTVPNQGQIRFVYSNITADQFEMQVDYRPAGAEDWVLGTYRMTAYRAG
jgi:hypothetical protein